MKGGSVASDSVVELVTSDTFSKLDAHFDNLVGGAKKTTKNTKSKKTSKPKTPEKKTTKTVKSVTPKTKKQVGGICAMCGGHMKHMNDFDDDGLFNLYNKKGGAAPLFEVQYDYDTSMAKAAHGTPINRLPDQSSIAAMATESPSSFGSMNKMVQYGNVFEGNNIPFSYSGGKSKKTKVKPKTSTKGKKSPSKK